LVNIGVTPGHARCRVPDFPALRDAALSVREVLRNAVTLSDDPALTGIDIDLRSPRELELAEVTGVISLWTHRLEVQPDLLNRAPHVRQVYERVLAGASVRSRYVEVAGDRVHLLEKSAGPPVVAVAALHQRRHVVQPGVAHHPHRSVAR